MIANKMKPKDILCFKRQYFWFLFHLQPILIIYKKIIQRNFYVNRQYSAESNKNWQTWAVSYSFQQNDTKINESKQHFSPHFYTITILDLLMIYTSMKHSLLQTLKISGCTSIFRHLVLCYDKSACASLLIKTFCLS